MEIVKETLINMKILCIDTSEKSLLVGVYIDGVSDYILNEDCNLKHSHTLFDTIEKLLVKYNMTLNDMDCFASVVGPGSFTGLRIGITAVRAFAQIMKKPVISVNSFDLKAYNIKTMGKYKAVFLDAMQKKVYYTVFDNLGNTVLDADVILEAEAKDYIAQKLNCDAFNISLIYEKQLDGFKECIMPAKESALVDIAVKMFKKGKLTDYSNLLPEYAQLSQAERNYKPVKADSL